VRILGVQVGKARPLVAGDRTVLSGIRKRAVTGTVDVHRLGLDGDEQADLTVHGGLAKAVYAYPVEHYPFWCAQQRELHGTDVMLPHGSLGENLTIEGLLEPDVFVGDVLRLPGCTLRVTQPRKPCFKFNAVTGNQLAARKMQQTGFCGFYLAVDETGTLAVGQSFDLVPGPREMPLLALFRFVHASAG
jgi:MOSC domain-containing protein YiiM